MIHSGAGKRKQADGNLSGVNDFGQILRKKISQSMHGGLFESLARANRKRPLSNLLWTLSTSHYVEGRVEWQNSRRLRFQQQQQRSRAFDKVRGSSLGLPVKPDLEAERLQVRVG
ncbi:uncharacterized protein PAC_12331 [Phialocephala subalpina]|uniref:Uncharacterized protein n=1 Tax=Phialocephala subalpina TaxID=576137 RepID=A0A1L7XBM5_9HELO|nr:uncharacterized protein PAC_12331 [Phialocephala subalpina]